MGNLEKTSGSKRATQAVPLPAPKLNEQRQKIFSDKYGDCFRACVASWLELPADVVPNDHSPAWFNVWDVFLDQFGLSLGHFIRSDGPLWASQTWLASVKSLNLEGTHAILMHDGGKVLFDPSTHKRYKKGSYLSQKEVIGGYHLSVSDVSKLHRLKEYREHLLGTGGNDLLNKRPKAKSRKAKAQS